MTLGVSNNWFYARELVDLNQNNEKTDDEIGSDILMMMYQQDPKLTTIRY